MSNKALFLDRDGTLNEDPGYLGDPAKLKLLPGVGESLAKLKNEMGFLLFIISNQSGIARGLISIDDVEAVNLELNNKLLNFDTSIDGFYYCPHHPDYDEKCSCRKPSPEMILNAAKKHQVDLEDSYMIGDNVTDIEAGKNAGLNTILVKTGYGKESFSLLQKDNKMPTFVAENFIEACNFIMSDISGDTN